MLWALMAKTGYDKGMANYKMYGRDYDCPFCILSCKKECLIWTDLGSGNCIDECSPYSHYHNQDVYTTSYEDIKHIAKNMVKRIDEAIELFDRTGD